jgi:hypothetical protein
VVKCIWKNVTFDEKSYVSANPRFFNESITEDDRLAVQNEFACTNNQGWSMTLDLMKNEFLLGSFLYQLYLTKEPIMISLVICRLRKANKNNKVDPTVMNDWAVVISNEFKNSNSIPERTKRQVPFKTGDNLLGYIR